MIKKSISATLERLQQINSKYTGDEDNFNNGLIGYCAFRADLLKYDLNNSVIAFDFERVFIADFISNLRKVQNMQDLKNFINSKNTSFFLNNKGLLQNEHHK